MAKKAAKAHREPNFGKKGEYGSHGDGLSKQSLVEQDANVAKKHAKKAKTPYK